MSEEKKEEVKTVMPDETKKAAEKRMYEYLLETFGDSAPTAEKVSGWKTKFRRVRLIPLSDEEVYFVRPIKRNEYKALLSTAQTGGGDDVESLLREQIVAKCVLWPIMDASQFSDSFAGTIDAIYQVIMDTSNFVSQEALFTVVREL